MPIAEATKETTKPQTTETASGSNRPARPRDHQRTAKRRCDIMELEMHLERMSYHSESDSPLGLFFYGRTAKGITPEEIFHVDIATKVHERSTPQEFFAPLVKHEDWHSSEEKMEVLCWQFVHSFFEKNLRDVEVWKFGRTEKQIFVLGLTESGDIMGFHTSAVET